MTKEEERISEQAISIATELFRTRQEMVGATYGTPHWKDLKRHLDKLERKQRALASRRGFGK